MSAEASSVERPSRTTPSAGTLPPGFTTTLSPTCSSVVKTRTSWPSRSTQQRRGNSSASLRERALGAVEGERFQALAEQADEHDLGGDQRLADQDGGDGGDGDGQVGADACPRRAVRASRRAPARRRSPRRSGRSGSRTPRGTARTAGRGRGSRSQSASGGHRSATSSAATRAVSRYRPRAGRGGTAGRRGRTRGAWAGRPGGRCGQAKTMRERCQGTDRRRRMKMPGGDGDRFKRREARGVTTPPGGGAGQSSGAEREYIPL